MYTFELGVKMLFGSGLLGSSDDDNTSFESSVEGERIKLLIVPSPFSVYPVPALVVVVDAGVTAVASSAR